MSERVNECMEYIMNIFILFCERKGGNFGSLPRNGEASSLLPVVTRSLEGFGKQRDGLGLGDSLGAEWVGE